MLSRMWWDGNLEGSDINQFLVNQLRNMKQGGGDGSMGKVPGTQAEDLSPEHQNLSKKPGS